MIKVKLPLNNGSAMVVNTTEEKAIELVGLLNKAIEEHKAEKASMLARLHALQQEEINLFRQERADDWHEIIELTDQIVCLKRQLYFMK